MELQQIVKSARSDPQFCMFLFACLGPPPKFSGVLSRDWVRKKSGLNSNAFIPTNHPVLIEAGKS